MSSCFEASAALSWGVRLPDPNLPIYDIPLYSTNKVRLQEVFLSILRHCRRDGAHQNWGAFLTLYPHYLHGLEPALVCHTNFGSPGQTPHFLLVPEKLERSFCCTKSPACVQDIQSKRQRGLFAVQTTPMSRGNGWFGAYVTCSGPDQTSPLLAKVQATHGGLSS
jgi:hypothetical protein